MTAVRAVPFPELANFDQRDRSSRNPQYPEVSFTKYWVALGEIRQVSPTRCGVGAKKAVN